jgi:23S rRNA (cytosine1962-C5)-methyltransferase
VGDIVRVFDRAEFIGAGFYHPHSLIRVRLFSANDEEPDAAFFARRIVAAVDRRRVLLPDEADCRLVYGESDGLPGLVIDRYGCCCAVQAYSAAIDRRLGLVVEALRDVCRPTSIYEKDDFRLRDIEGLPRREGPLWGDEPSAVQISEGGARFLVDIAGGQKTGYYYDHRCTRRRVRELAGGRAVLDVFAYTGSFAVNAALGGACEVTAVDSSADALRAAAANAELNGVADRCRFVTGDAFEVLQALVREGRKFGLVNVDPPAFAKSARERPQGLRAYRRIVALAMGLLAEGGVLVASSCSHHFDWSDLLEALAGAALDAGRRFTILGRATQGPDHPVLLSMPETEYLRGFILGTD